MPLFKFSLILFLLSLHVSAINDNECIKSSFDVEVIHKGQPFGLLPVTLTISKKECILNISHEKLKVFKKNWEVDVCREPVHIKSGRGAVEVLKKTSDCEGESSSGYCSEQKNLFQVIQDDGLIFAPGEKENLATDHGKVYCSYLLVKRYLENSLVFNRGEDYRDVLSGNGQLIKKEIVIEKEMKDEKETSSVPRPTIVGGGEASVTPDEEKEVEESAPQKDEKEGTGSF